MAYYFGIKLSLLLTLCCFANIFGQAFPDNVLTINATLKSVKTNHPLAYQARLQNDFAKAELLKIEGSFDPEISSQINQKYYDDKGYHSLFSGELKIPTWIGADIKAGYEANKGAFLSPENNTPANGLYYGGISMPLGQGLWIDDRRAKIKNARIQTVYSSAVSNEMLNEILYNSAKTYYEWFKTFNVKNILNESLKNAEQRLDAVRKSAINGDRPNIDTVEARIQISNIELALNHAHTEFKNTNTIFSGYFWNENQINSGLDAAIIPPLTEEEIKNKNNEKPLSTIENFIQNHPYLEQLRQKLKQYEVERSLKKDKLKPHLNIRYNPLTEATSGNFMTNYSINNYKWGMEFKMPLFLRKERGEIKISELKIQETDLLLRHKSIELYNKLASYFTEWQATFDQIEIYKEAVSQYEQMYIAEKKLFSSGESSIFLVNTRELAFINAKIKLTELVSKNRIAYYSMLYFSGQLGAVVPD